MFLHENVQHSRHCVTYFHIKMKIGCIYESSWPSYISRMMEEMQMIKIIIKKIILSITHQALPYISSSHIFQSGIINEM